MMLILERFYLIIVFQILFDSSILRIPLIQMKELLYVLGAEDIKYHDILAIVIVILSITYYGLLYGVI